MEWNDDLLKSIELATLWNQAPAEHLEKSMQKKAQKGEGHWVTVNGGTSAETGEHHGTHIFVDGHGNVTKGPKELVEKLNKKKADTAPKVEEPKPKKARAKKTADPMTEADALKNHADKLHAQGHMDGHAHFVAHEIHRQAARAHMRAQVATHDEERQAAHDELGRRMKELHKHVDNYNFVNKKAQSVHDDMARLLKKVEAKPEMVNDYGTQIDQAKRAMQVIQHEANKEDGYNKHTVYDLTEHLSMVHDRLKRSLKHYK